MDQSVAPAVGQCDFCCYSRDSILLVDVLLVLRKTIHDQAAGQTI
jgi:hypothetical protein